MAHSSSLHTRPIRPLMLLLSLTLLQSAYVGRIFQNGTPGALGSQGAPVTYRIWSGLNANHASIVPDSSPRRILREALERWARVSSFSLILGADTPNARTDRDGINMVTIAESPEDRRIVGNLPLAVTKIWEVGGRVVEADTIFNPRYQWSTDEARGDYNLLRTAMHEFGHSLGLSHSINRDSTMFFTGGQFEYDFNRLTWDDIAGINVLGPLTGLDRITGQISGTVTKAGRPVFGAMVAAVDGNGLLAGSTITYPNGCYHLRHLPPGPYALYVEPLDGPMTPAHIVVSGMNSSSMDAAFLPQFYRHDPDARVAVTAFGVSRADFQVSAGSARLDPAYLRVDSDPFDSGNFWILPAEAKKGRRLHLGLAGDGAELINDDDGIDFLSPSLRPGPVSRVHQNSDGVQFKWFGFDTAPETLEGSYSIVLRGGAGQLGVISGGLKVLPEFRYQQGFAHFVQVGNDSRSQILMINRGDWDARVRLLRRSANGKAVAPSLIDAANRYAEEEFTVPGHGGVWLQSDGSDGDWVASLEAMASGPLASTVLLETRLGVAGLTPSLPLHALITPVEVKGGGRLVNTGLALMNQDPRPVEICLQLRDAGGQVQDSTVVGLAGHGRASMMVTELFPAVEQGFVGTVAATSNRAIGAGVIRTSPAVFTTLPVIQNRVSTSLYFAQFAHRAGLASELWLVNPSPVIAADRVSVIFRDAQGGATDLELNGRPSVGGTSTVNIPPRGLVRLRTTAGDAAGWVQVRSQTPVAGVLLFQSPQWGVAGVGESRPERSLVVPLDQEGPLRQMGLAIVNVETRLVDLKISVRNLDGTVIAETRMTLAPHQQIAGLVNREPFNWDIPRSFKGSAWFEADGELALTALRQEPGALISFPPYPLHDTFKPRY